MHATPCRAAEGYQPPHETCETTTNISKRSLKLLRGLTLSSRSETPAMGFRPKSVTGFSSLFLRRRKLAKELVLDCPWLPPSFGITADSSMCAARSEWGPGSRFISLQYRPTVEKPRPKRQRLFQRAPVS